MRYLRNKADACYTCSTSLCCIRLYPSVTEKLHSVWTCFDVISATASVHASTYRPRKISLEEGTMTLKRLGHRTLTSSWYVLFQNQPASNGGSAAPPLATFYNPAQFGGGPNLFSQPSSTSRGRGRGKGRRGYPNVGMR